MYHRLLALVLLSCLSALPMQAQSLDADSNSAPTQDTLPPVERHIRVGIVLLNSLKDCLYQVDNHDKAESAAPQILELQMKLLEWGDAFNTLPPSDAETLSQYKKIYLPIITNLNDALRLQAERLKGADYYQSKNFASALLRLVETIS